MKKKDNVPGPGQYSMRSTFSHRFGAPFGTGKRSTQNLNKSVLMPGPGAYEPTSEFGNKGNGIGFGKSIRGNAKNQHLMPGPGQYTVNDILFRDPKAASLKGRPKTTKEELRPGPGHYKSSSINNSPAYSMGIKTKLKELTERGNPGPGGYNPEYTKVKQSPPGVAFGSPSKATMKGDNMPGPGQYALRTTVGTEGPSYGIRGRHEHHPAERAPGPGNYNPKDDLVRHGTPGTVMGSGTRDGFGIKGEVPGPGNYDLNHSLNKGKMYSFGGEKRDGSKDRSKENPGPGSYAIQTFVGKDSQGKTISGKSPTKYGNDNPGPGTYAPNDHKNGPAYSLMGHRTEDPVLKEKAKMPPPGSYNPNDALTKYNSPNVSFGSGLKSSALKGDGMPGPGQYQLKSTLAEQGVVMGIRSPEKIKEKAPGPGAYNPKNDLKYHTNPSFSMSGVGGEQYNPTKGMPGPGTYDVSLRPGTGIKFGTDKRDGSNERGDMPGPGQYQIPSTIMKDGKNIIITGRHEDKKDVNQVGPGQYQLPSMLSGPKYSMGSENKGTKLNKDALMNPPPGTYTVDPNAGKHGAPGIVFGKEVRDRMKADQMPGPGNYAVPSTIDQHGITIGK